MIGNRTALPGGMSWQLLWHTVLQVRPRRSSVPNLSLVARAAGPMRRLPLAGGPVATPPRFSPALVMEMRAQGLSEEDALAALETCDGDGEKVRLLVKNARS